jgi:hypothetical protein
MEVKIRHWRFEDGKVRSYNHGTGIIDTPEPIPRGWYCWAFPDDHGEFLDWMKRFCPTTDCTPRFNSGDPMIQIHITEDKEATLFQLKWL